MKSCSGFKIFLTERVRVKLDRLFDVFFSSAVVWQLHADDFRMILFVLAFALVLVVLFLLRNLWIYRNLEISDRSSFSLVKPWLFKPTVFLHSAVFTTQMLRDEQRLTRDIPGIEAERRFGVQVFTATNGSEHSLHRSVVAKSLRREFQPLLQQMVERRSLDLIEELRRSASSPLDLFPFLVRFVSVSIMQFVYGSTAAERSLAKERISPLARIASFLAPAWLQPVLETWPLRQVRRARELDHKLSRQALKDFAEKGEEAKDCGTLLYLLHRSNEGALSDRDLIANAGIFSAGGTDSTASVLCSALFCLCKHPEMQRKVVEDPSFLDFFIKEVLRCYPPFPVIGYRRSVDGPYQFGKQEIPRGVCAAVNLFEMQKSERFWGNDAALFRPERWKEETLRGEELFYFPWGGGPRMCVGKPLALSILRGFLSAISKNFSIEHCCDSNRQSLDDFEPCSNAFAGVTAPPAPLKLRFVLRP